MGCVNWEIYVRTFIGLMAIFVAPFCHGLTDPRDVSAANSLYASLGFPPLPGWVPLGGDPCAEGWQGILCVNANITGIVLPGANIGGVLSDNLGDFASIIQIDLSNNHIAGSVPSNLPVTIRSFFLSDNQFTGSIPAMLSSLGQLSDLSLNDNHLSGELPDAFQQLTGLTNLDLSGNNLSGQLPPSMENLSSLYLLHLQNNQFVGTLDVLQDLPLRDLNIENNLFSGPIPEKLLGIPNFRRSGNPFNTTIIPSPPASAPSPSPSEALPPVLTSGFTPGTSAKGPSAPKISNSTRGGKFFTAKRVTWIAIAGSLLFMVIALGACLFMSGCCKGSQASNKIDKRHEMGAYNAPKEKPRRNESSLKPYNHTGEVSKEAVLRPPAGYGKSSLRLKPDDEWDIDLKGVATSSIRKEDHVIDMMGNNANVLPPPSPSPPITLKRHSTKSLNSVKSFTIAFLQQYTNSFSQENLVGGGMIGTVYRAELPGGKLLAVKKLDTAASRQLSDEDFLELVSGISKLRHANVVELMGYCAEHGQRLLVYSYCNNGTLHEALHMDDEVHKKLSWNTRIRLALGAAKALEYLHEVCQPPIVHRNFKSANILLDDELAVHVSDCGLAPLITSNSASQLQGHGYGAPELECGNYNYQSDTYSFGVVMLELLTGRKSYDSSRPRGEQFLVRWAIPQLHDINALSRMVDPSLNGMYPSKSLSRFADIISLCVQAEPEFRPPMSEIVQNLLHTIQRDP
ncbi:protein STRUBBELIG-RECEPTOR FAMILY 3-like [Cornus florida]|uniref:protein STRUBBELIG-RECEPTOR FAMILY 3-like n=1 Tax=Cornus florida TaxID=4283 RepID=UPI002897B719|nr:protein STRUBBELIG-RECEPTOR FAMILY 3-like [Cornus florida]